MTEHTLILHPHEVRGLRADPPTVTLIMRPVKPQPPVGLSKLDVPGPLWTYTCCDRDWVCPFGTVGDRLIGKETWAVHDDYVLYKADLPEVDWKEVFEDTPNHRWLSPILMPRKLSRFTPEVTADPWCKQVQEMTAEECIAWGCQTNQREYDAECLLRDLLARQWDAIYARRGLGWDAKTWMWGVTIRRIG